MKRFSIYNFQNGFTLIELLAVIVVLVSIGGIVAAIFFSTLRGTSKANQITLVRQNGEYAVSEMSKILREAKTLDSPATCTTLSPYSFQTITVTLFDGGQTTFSCINNTISSNSASLVDTNTVTVSSCSFTCTRLTIADTPIVGIQFTLSQKAQGGFFENQASIPFDTTVTLRNIAR